jgi:peptidoglycan/LPS O-acetylase OafA/YrhL
MAMFPPDWSVSTEWFFYFAFVPLVFLVMWLRRPCAAMMGGASSVRSCSPAALFV